MATGTLTPTPYQSVFDVNGNPVPGALITTYLAGTTTGVATYTDAALSVPNANPIVADSAGRYVAFLTPGISYKFAITTAASVAIRTVDNIAAVPISNVLEIQGLVGEVIGAGKFVYLSDGSGGKTAGQWYVASSDNAYSSTLPVVGYVDVAIGLGATGGTIRLAGKTLASAGVAGSDYYISSTGTFTTTAPANRRYVGRADSTGAIILVPNPSQPRIDVTTAEGRLTLTSATPVTTADVLAAGTLYYALYKGNLITLYDGTLWQLRSFAELSIAVPAIANQMYDVFVYDNAGTVTLELLAWTSDTARATALVLQDGVWVKTGATTRRYLGSFRTLTASQTEDSFAKRLVWNMNNRVRRLLRVLEATATWTYTTTTLRQANAAATNQLAAVVGIAESAIHADVMVTVANPTTGVTQLIAIGEDSTTTAVAGCRIGWIQSNVQAQQLRSDYDGYVPIGYHVYTWLEYSAATGTTTWYGNNGGGSGTPRNGISGWIDG